MADEQPTQNPVPTPAPVAPSISDKLKMDAKTLWNEHKLFFIIFGALILLVKFRDIAIDLLVSGAKKEMADAKKEDAGLATDEKKANDAANQLVQQAKDEPLKEGPIDDDWNKKP
jgi:hypothetical protein